MPHLIPLLLHSLSIFLSAKNPKRLRGGRASGSGCVNHPASCLFVSLQEALQRRRDGGKSRSGWFHTSQSIGLRERFRAVFSSFLMVTESAASLTERRTPPSPPPSSVDRLLMTFHRQLEEAHSIIVSLPATHRSGGGGGRWGGTGASSCSFLENGGVKQAHWAWT